MIDFITSENRPADKTPTGEVKLSSCFWVLMNGNIISRKKMTNILSVISEMGPKISRLKRISSGMR